MKTTIFKIAISTSCLLSLLACGPKDVDKVADAQNCLDSATAATADACVAKVDGLESSGAYLVRCSGKFVKEGFNETSKLSLALGNLAGGNTGAVGSTSVMAAMAFTAESTPALNSTSAQQAFEYCTKSKSKGLILLSGISQTSTVVAVLGGQNLATLTGAQLQTLMGTLQSDPVAQTAVGSAVSSIYTANCTNNSTVTGGFCQQFESAITAIPGGVSNPAGIGAQIMKCYSTPAAAGCTGY